MEKITVIGMGYVGLPFAILLTKKYFVYGLERNVEKVRKINGKQSPFQEEEIQNALENVNDNLYVSSNPDEALIDAKYVFIALPTDYIEEKKTFDLETIIQMVIRIRKINKKALIIVRSTLPIGGLDYIRRNSADNQIIYMPEFIRELHTMCDNQYPSRVVYGVDDKNKNVLQLVMEFHENYLQCIKIDKRRVLFVGVKEAEAIKLFSNAYLAARVSFFNELDSFAELSGLDSKATINGICMDPRIGDFYNIPSFGYGGYCLPKDVKQLNANMEGISSSIIQSIDKSNKERKKHIVDSIVKKCTEIKETDGERLTIGFFRANAKEKSDNCRNSASLAIMSALSEMGFSILLYEPCLDGAERIDINIEVTNDIALLKIKSDVIVANRYETILDDVKDKVYTRDIGKGLY